MTDFPPCKCGGEATWDTLLMRGAALLCVYCKGCRGGVFSPDRDEVEELWTKAQMEKRLPRDELDFDAAIDTAMALGDYEKAHRLLARKRARG